MTLSTWQSILSKFIIQSHTRNLKRALYPIEFDRFEVKISFGMGQPSRIPWIAFIPNGMQIYNGFYPIYLYYKDHQTLILAYGIGELANTSWPSEIAKQNKTISDYFNMDTCRYGNSLVFKSYKIRMNQEKVDYIYDNTKKRVTEQNMESDLDSLLLYYRKLI